MYYLEHPFSMYMYVFQSSFMLGGTSLLLYYIDTSNCKVLSLARAMTFKLLMSLRLEAKSIAWTMTVHDIII